MPTDRLRRSETNRMIAGVCGGIGQYLNIDPTLVRLAFLLLIPASGIGLILYLLLLVLMPGEHSASQEPARIVRENIDDLGRTVGQNLDRLGQKPGHSLSGGLILILLGGYFLLQNLGWFRWLHFSLVWPLLIIAAGIYLLLRRRE